jgi:glycosyltransferase involved in cell wall biosynthesis
MIYADQRWVGDHGIGRFARHVLADQGYSPIPLTGHPAAPLDTLRLTRALRGLSRDDLFFSPGYTPPLSCPSPFVITIHDLSHIHCPENSSSLIRLYYATVMKRACRRAARILTVSEFTRAEILDWAGLHPNAVRNVGCGVEPSYRPDGDVSLFPFPYLLCVSNRKRHKNEARVVGAFAQSGLAQTMRLVFTGDSTPQLARCIEQHHLTTSIGFVGRVPEDRLPPLYRGAEALIFPSLYEGFGLPILEAMACGTPVVTANITGMPETAGGAALLVDPTLVDEIAEAMKRVVSDTSLRRQLRDKGLVRASTFSWQHTAGLVREILTTRGEQSARRNPCMAATVRR